MSSQPLVIGKFSLGMGDRFAHEAEAQLAACVAAKKLGVEIVPVWNKSNREHNIIGSEPTSTRAAADAAVKTLGWTAPYFLDADHIGLKTVERFVGVSDFFTIDVADFIAQPADPAAVKAFVDRHPELVGTLTLAGIDRPFTTTRADVERTAAKFLLAVQEAGKVYRHIVSVKGVGRSAGAGRLGADDIVLAVGLVPDRNDLDAKLLGGDAGGELCFGFVGEAVAHAEGEFTDDERLGGHTRG